MKIIKSKRILVKNRLLMVELLKEGHSFIVKVDGDVYKQTPNELFAVQAFNSI